MDTTFNALARILHLLSERPELQEKLLKEVSNAGDAELDYETLNALPFTERRMSRVTQTVPTSPPSLQTDNSRCRSPARQPHQNRRWPRN
ncbi:hypothetical protein DFP72DRAFT_908000 [Ephemerocybe angulata]|uniref:Uncharacterized protein n=1 Tax=Ephemerocybe angulata TaxID=980116 RepID=A0A8H6HQF2_9AGAR|nr:hypothetical protein DFP72DRAFT_908000 [Tulosesus angulatus]